MQRKPGFPAANCNIKMPDSVPSDNIIHEEDSDQQQRRQQLINFGHSQWGFNNWSWSVSKQELDFVDFANGKYSAGVVAFVSINVKSFEIHRENIGYATCVATIKGSAIYRARKCAVTNALKETLLSFGGSITTELLELLESHKNDLNNQTGTQQNQQNDVLPENNQNLANKLLTTNISIEPKNASTSNTRTIRKDSSDSNSSRDNATVSARSPQNAAIGAPLVKNAVACGPSAPLVAKAHPMPANQPAAKPALPANQPRGPPPPAPAPSLPPAPAPASMPIQPHHIRPNSNEPTKSDAISSLAGVSASVGAGTTPGQSEDARTERKRRQRLAQEQFRQRHLTKQPPEGTDAATQELEKNSIDSLLLEIPSQDLSSNAQSNAKRKSIEIAASVKRPALTSINISK